MVFFLGHKNKTQLLSGKWGLQSPAEEEFSVRPLSQQQEALCLDFNNAGGGWMNPHRAPSRNHCLPPTEGPSEWLSAHSRTAEEGGATLLLGFYLGPLTRISLRITSLLWTRVNSCLLLGWTPCDPDDSIFSLNGMHGKLSKKYLDKFPEARLNKDVSILPAGTVFSSREDSMGRTPRRATFAALF